MQQTVTTVPSVWPTLVYRDPRAALDFLTSAFGFAERSVYVEEGVVVHAELTWVGPAGTVLGGVMFGPEHPGSEADRRAGQGSIHVVVDDPDALCARAEAAGATILRPLEDTPYGSRQFIAADPEGNVFSFGTWYEPLDAEVPKV